MSMGAPLPPLSLSVGIVGHRADRIVDADAVRSRLDELLGGIDAALAGPGRRQPHGKYMGLRLVSALAEGADRLAAETAFERGMPLVAVLPFRAEEYERDFADGLSRETFQTLLGQAEAVIILDGAVDGRDRAYDGVGVALLENCDLLIAVWDGEPGRGRGGTREVIEEAARRAMPVVIVSPDGASATIRSAGADAGPMRFDDVPTLPASDLPVVVETIVAGASANAEETGNWQRLAKLPRAPLIHGAYPLLLRLAGVAPRRRRQVAEAAPSEEKRDTLGEAFHWWDAAAIRSAQAFRSAVIVNFALAALAVVLAAVSVLAGHQQKWLFVAAEVATILLLLANTLSARRRDWQERWLESREVAELLRVSIMLRRVGIGRGVAAGGGWIGWYAGALARGAAPEGANLFDLAPAGPLLAEVEDQAKWNAATAHRMHLAAHRIERFGEILFGLVLAAAIGWLVLHFITPEQSYALQYPLTALTAGLPAIATASYGIRVILDFEGVAERSHRIAIGLEALLAKWQVGTRDGAALQDFARRAADIMLADVAAWRLLAEGRRLTIPG